MYSVTSCLISIVRLQMRMGVFSYDAHSILCITSCICSETLKAAMKESMLQQDNHPYQSPITFALSCRISNVILRHRFSCLTEIFMKFFSKTYSFLNMKYHVFVQISTLLNRYYKLKDSTASQFDSKMEEKVFRLFRHIQLTFQASWKRTENEEQT